MTWAINHFKVLPTDQKLKDMPFEWLEYLFCNYLTTEDYSKVRERYKEMKLEERRREEIKEDLLPYLPDLGYTEEEAIKIISEVQ